MRYLYLFLITIFFTSCSYYRFKTVNLEKVKPTQVYYRASDLSEPDVFIHTSARDSEVDYIKASNVRITDSSFIFDVDSVSIHPVQKSYYKSGLLYTEVKHKGKVSGKLKPEDEEYIEQVHLIIADSMSFELDSNVMLNNSRIEEVHVVETDGGRSILYVLLLLLGIGAVAFLFIIIASIDKIHP